MSGIIMPPEQRNAEICTPQDEIAVYTQGGKNLKGGVPFTFAPQVTIFFMQNVRIDIYRYLNM